MNCKFLKASLLMISASVLFLAGCGPQDVTDAQFLAETANQDTSNKDAQDHQGPGHSEGDGCPTGGCATGDCENPPEPDTAREVKLPDQYSTQPTKVTPTHERQLATHIIDYKTTKHVYQPHERHHTTHEHDKTIRRHHTTVVYHPTTKRINRVVKTASVEDEVMPTQEVVAEPVDYGCSDAVPAPQPVLVRPVVPVYYPFFGRLPYRY